MTAKAMVGPVSLAARAVGSQTGQRYEAGSADYRHHSCPASGGARLHGPHDSLMSESPGHLNSVASQDRSLPSPASKSLPELFSCPLTLLLLKSGQPDSPGRQPRGQGPRQALSLPYSSAVAGCDWVAFVSTKEMTRSFRRLSEKGATGLLAGGSPGVRLSLFSAVQAFLFTSDPGPWASAYPGAGPGMEISSRTSLPREPSAGCPNLKPWALYLPTLSRMG